ncbi:glycosyltransferase [Rhizobium sp. BE258]|uniref:glycosyltransferase n=1 Tax=Rhizobium sp. BE258 TaxID=2817722 RepID=UPI002866ABE0|nr:glycosyltransferase [Rhizobium sp. BE258]MDR7145202.1 glycosyltransferase involved in cell wall biosynthesis [Rhizobium sp. BE258]
MSDHLKSLKRYKPTVLTEADIDASHRAAVPVVNVGKSRVSRFLFSRLGWSPKLSGVVEKSRPAIIHAHFLIDAARLKPYLEKNDIPLIVTAHGYDATLNDAAFSKFEDGRLYLRRADWLKKRVSRVVCVSDFIRGELLERGFPPEKLLTIPLGVDLENLVRPSAKARSGVLSVGRLVEKKGMEKLVRAYSLLSEQERRENPLTIIGDGPLRFPLETLASELKVSVNFGGSAPRERVLDAMTSNAVFCLPSIRAKDGDAEGMPIVLMEALALGTPVVIFDDQPMAEMLNRWSAGRTAIAGSPEALATELRKVLSAPSLANDLATRGRQLCEDNFSLHENVRKLESLYDDLVGARGR